MNKLRILFATSRPISWVNTAYPFAAGYLVSGGSIDTRFIIGTLFFLIPYNLLMYGLNDVYDYESDIRNPRKGGVEGAITPKRFHPLIVWSSALLSVPFVIFLLLTGTLLSSLILLLVVFFAAAYSINGLRFKEVPFLDSITSSVHFCGPLLVSLALAGFDAAAIPAIVSFFFWGMASHAFGAVQDIIPDREGGIRSIATRLGASRTIWFALLLYMASALSLVGYSFPGMILAGVVLLYVLNIWPYRNITDKKSRQVNRAWKRFLYLNQFAGFVLTLVLLYQFLPLFWEG